MGYLAFTINILLISNHNIFRELFDKNCFRIFLSEENIYILALEMVASPGNQHGAICISVHFRSLLQTPPRHPFRDGLL